MLEVIKRNVCMKIFPSVSPGTLQPPCEAWQSRAGWWRWAGEGPPGRSDSTRRTGNARVRGWCWSTVHPSGLRSVGEMLYTHLLILTIFLSWWVFKMCLPLFHWSLQPVALVQRCVFTLWINKILIGAALKPLCLGHGISHLATP